MSKKAFREIRDLNAEELEQRLRKELESLFEAKIEKALNRLGPHLDRGAFWKKRKAIAMIKTVQTQRISGGAK
jgi:ribosomal protein L29